MPKKTTKKTFRICYFRERAKRKELENVLKIIKEERLIIYNSVEDAIATIGYVHKLPQEKVNLLKEYLK